jgi:hypothetical protein
MPSDKQVIPTDPHPSPQRGKVSLGALWFGIWGAPLAWISLELLSYILTTAICNTDSHIALRAHADKVSHYLVPISLIACLIALLAAVTAVHNWRKTRHEKSGSAHQLLEVGEGRTRFLAMFGLLTSSGFIIALFFSSAMLFLIPLCK